MRERIDAAAFKEMFLCANAALEENKQTINDLNVFPVPDGDTGTNMSLTMNAAAIALSKETFELRTLCDTWLTTQERSSPPTASQNT